MGSLFSKEKGVSEVPRCLLPRCTAVDPRAPTQRGGGVGGHGGSWGTHPKLGPPVHLQKKLLVAGFPKNKASSASAECKIITRWSVLRPSQPSALSPPQPGAPAASTVQNVRSSQPSGSQQSPALSEARDKFNGPTSSACKQSTGTQSGR